MTSPFDRWLTTQPEPDEERDGTNLWTSDVDEFDPRCSCGYPGSDHVTYDHPEGYEAIRCPHRVTVTLVFDLGDPERPLEPGTTEVDALLDDLRAVGNDIAGSHRGNLVDWGLKRA
jgi:hypothetical protein